MTKKEKGDYFEHVTKYLFENYPALCNNLQQIWLYSDIPKKIITELNLPDTDKGIDILAKINDTYIAIQCKFRQDPNEIITWGCAATFLASLYKSKKIVKGYLVSNTYNACADIVDSDIIVIGGDYFESLDNFFPIPSDFSEKKANYIVKTPRPYQETCCKLAVKHFIKKDKNNGRITMACGSGKTLTAYWIYNNLCAQIINSKIVIFVPSLNLLSQFYIDWVNQSFAEDNPINYVLIGSDVDTDEVKDKVMGISPCTNPKQIRKLLQTDTKTVVICTYQSADKLAIACGKNIKFDLGIFDEAHRTVGKSGSKFSLMLHDKNLIINKRLFMTATPKLYKGINRKIAGMNRTSIYGKCFFEYNIRQSITEGTLTDYQILTLCATNDSIKEDIETNRLVKYQDKFENAEANYLGIILVILKKIHEGIFNHLVTYHNKVNRAKEFAKYLNKINKLVYGEDDDIFVTSIDGSDSMRVRKNTIREFTKAKKSIICSSRVLNEGVNIPVIDSVCFVDPRISISDIIQCIGRCLRLYNDKTKAYILVPIFADNLDGDHDKHTFDGIIKILKALKQSDTNIVEYFQLRTAGKNQKSHGSNSIKEILLVDPYVDVSKEINLIKWYKVLDAHIFKVGNLNKPAELVDPVSIDLVRTIGTNLPHSNEFPNIKKLGADFKIFHMVAEKNKDIYVFKIITRNKYNKNGIYNPSFNLVTDTDKKNYKEELALLKKTYDIDKIHCCYIIVQIEKYVPCIYYWGKFIELNEKYTTENIINEPKMRVIANVSEKKLKEYHIFGKHSWSYIQKKYFGEDTKLHSVDLTSEDNIPRFIDVTSDSDDDVIII